MLDIINNGADALALLEARGWKEPKTALTNLRLISQTPLSPYLSRLLELAELSPSPNGCLNNIERLMQTVSHDVISKSLSDDAAISRLAALAASSPMLVNVIARNPEYYAWLFIHGGLFERRTLDAFSSELKARLNDIADFDKAARALRIYKQKEFLRIGSRDILGLSDLEETVTELSDLASAALDAAADFVISALKLSYGAPKHIDYNGCLSDAVLSIIGLGKLGGRELNFSSDIDIIFLYSSDNGETTGIDNRAETRISLHAFFVKAATLVTRLISQITDEGFVFRVDLNLRPDGKGGEAAVSLLSAEIYYESWGQSWERAAMLKARVVAGDAALGSQFIDMLRPFVFRRHLDFTALEEIKVMKERIDLSLLRAKPDTVDVKLGIGGIREIEFFCQALQLIHAGKDPALRKRGTLGAIEALTLRGLIRDPETAAALKSGYIFLRRLEHRIQIVEGSQSQTIPALPDELTRLARMMGFVDTPSTSSGGAFWLEYKRITERIHEIYRTLFYGADKELDSEIPENIKLLFAAGLADDDAALELTKAGFKDAQAAVMILSRLKDASQMLRLGPRTQVLLSRLMPVFIHRAVMSAEPDKAIAYLERLIFSIGPRPTFYSLLAENPLVIDELMNIFGTSRFLSNRLIERPESLDLLLSKELSVSYKQKDRFLTELDAAADYEDAIDELRRLKNQEIFRIGISDLRGSLNEHTISNQITYLAQAALNAAIAIAASALKPIYGAPQAGWFAILGLGKLGASELIYGSDLDIVFVYDEKDDSSRTDGQKPISSHEYYIKLAQRVISILTMRTREGFVFDVDARLRPSGSSGPLVVSRKALLGYHASSTSIWERQAWLKARAVAGNIKAGSDALYELSEIIYSRSISPFDIDEIWRIRQRMELEIAKETKGRYNLKCGCGGLVDIEFLTQALQLFAGAHDKSMRAARTRKALKRLFAAGMLESEDFLFLKKTYTFYRQLELKQRIVDDRPEGNLVAGSAELEALARRFGYTGEKPDAELLDEYIQRAFDTRKIFLKILKALHDRCATQKS